MSRKAFGLKGHDMSCDSHSRMPNGQIIRCNGDHYAKEPHRAILGSEDFPEPVYWPNYEGESDANAENSVGSWATSNPPDRYVGKDMQAWDVIEAFDLDFFEGSALKYLLRYKKKGGRDDLEKLIHYATRLREQWDEGLRKMQDE